MDLRRNVRCSGCGNEISFNFNGDLDLTQMTAVGKCPSCSTTIQIDFAVVEKERASEYVSPSMERETSGGQLPNLEEALNPDRGADIPAGILKDLME